MNNEKIKSADKFIPDLIDRIVSKYFHLEKPDKLLLKFFNEYGKFFEREIQKNKQILPNAFYDIQIPFKIFCQDFMLKNPDFNISPKNLELIIRWIFRAYCTSNSAANCTAKVNCLI